MNTTMAYSTYTTHAILKIHLNTQDSNRTGHSPGAGRPVILSKKRHPNPGTPRGASRLVEKGLFGR